MQCGGGTAELRASYASDVVLATSTRGIVSTNKVINLGSCSACLPGCSKIDDHIMPHPVFNAELVRRRVTGRILRV